MLIGIISDAHDRVQGVRDALRVFSEPDPFRRDMIGFGYCFAFKGLVILVKLIYGNNDGDRHGLQNFPSGV